MTHLWRIKWRLTLQDGGISNDEEDEEEEEVWILISAVLLITFQ